MSAARAGIIGAGAFGAFLLDSITGLPGVEASAVFDTDEERAAAIAATYDLRQDESVEQMLADRGIDIVVIASPPASHGALAIAALAAGKNVFCEKPLALDAHEALAVLVAAKAAPGPLVVDHVLRYNPILRLLLQLRDEGLLDPVARYSFENDASDENLFADHWFWNDDLSGGIFIEHGVHFFDAAQALIGAFPDEVQGMHVARGDGIVDTVVATTRTGASCATFAHGFSHAGRCERQLTCVDFGFAQARITGWIPTHVVIDAWVDEVDIERWAALPSRGAELLAIPGYAPSQTQTVSVAVTQDALAPVKARGRGQERDAPHHVVASVGLGIDEASCKAYVYGQSVRAAFTDLITTSRSGAQPVADAMSGYASVVVASAARESAMTGRTVKLQW